MFGIMPLSQQTLAGPEANTVDDAASAAGAASLIPALSAQVVAALLVCCAGHSGHTFFTGKVRR